MLKSGARLVIGLSVVVEVILVACAVTDSRPSTVSDYMKQKIAAESAAAIALDSFEKTNGYDQQAKGLQLYVLEWQAQISAQSEFWKSGDAFVGYWQNFGVMTQPTGLLTGSTKHFVKGTVIRLTGDSHLQDTEQGWRVVELSVKTMQVLSEPEDPTLRALAEHLSRSGAKLYGPTWCSKCEEQSRLFGSSAHRLPRVECSATQGAPLDPECQAAGIITYPTWMIDGRRIEDLLSLKQLADAAGFKGTNERH